MKPVDRSIPIAAYYQIAMDIQNRIAAGEWADTLRLPSEALLAESYQVSRMTIRQALAELIKGEMIVRRRGVGTFILKDEPTRPRLTMALPLPTTVVRRLTDAGYKVRSCLHKTSVMAVPSSDIAESLRLDLEENVAFFERRITVDERMLVISRSMIPNSLCEGITDTPLINDSIQETLAKNHGVRVTHSRNWLEAVRATDEEAAILGAERGAPLILVTSVFYAANSAPVEYVSNLWHGDIVRFYVGESVAPSKEVNQMVL